MKKIKNILYTCLLSAALFSCADDDMPAGSLQVKEGIPVTLTLSYQMLDDIKVTSRAAEGEQTGGNGTTENKKPNDYGLQIFIFNKAGVLTGYKSLTEAEFHYNESEEQSVKIETLTGKSYIYAVANYNSNRYKVNGLNGEKPNINRDDFLKLTFERDAQELEIPEDETKILMSGRYQDETDNGRNVDDDGSCTIALENGMVVIYNRNSQKDAIPIIYLKRVVSKVTFNINLSADALEKKVEFKPLSYEIHNITKKGNLLGYLPREITNENRDITGYEIEDDYVYKNFFIQESPNSFTLYIPENLQKVKNTCDSWHKREANTYDEETKKIKSFTNAPDDGTYVVIKGTYHDTQQKLWANVEYTIHLGDFGGADEKSRNYNNFDNERNCEYTYKVTVKNANEITVEAKGKEKEDKPGTEGLVINYNKGKAYTVDSHYEAVIMRIYKQDKYQFMVETPWGGMSEHVSTGDEDYLTKLANLDVNWLSFALVSDVASAVKNSSTDYPPTIDYEIYLNMKYDGGNPKGGNVPFLAYTYTINGAIDNLKSFQEFFSYLLTNTQWEKDENNKEYIDVICFIDEYYYSDDKYAIDLVKTDNSIGTKTARPWNEYTNTTPRSFYLLETVAVSPDGHSTYMEVSHSISQYSIQTFYNPTKAEDIMAYGCEYISNEDPSNSEPDLPDGVEKPSIIIDDKTEISGYVYWNGRVNTMLDIKSGFTSGGTFWKEILIGVSKDTKGQQPKLRWAFVDRNRDLDRDGKIDQDEIRWYTPTISQYCGFWLGEDAIATEARLYNGKLTEAKINKPYDDLNKDDCRHYYNSTPKNRVFWAEEGFSYSTFSDDNDDRAPRYVRCIRNLGKIGSNGVEAIDNCEPTKYYTYNNNRIFDLTNMDSKTLRSGAVLNGLLPPHAERQREDESINNNLIRDRFELAQGREQEGNKDKTFSIQEITQNGWYNNNQWKPFNGEPISLNYTQQDGDNGKNVGAWRIPNQRELCVIAIETVNQQSVTTGNTSSSTLGVGGDACATFCTNPQYRQGYYIRRSSNGEITVSMTSKCGLNDKNFYIRPVRDIAE